MTYPKLRSWSAALLSTVAVGCATDPTQGPDEQPEVDNEAPTVVSTLPAVNGIGVAAGDKITITFSEAMDRSSIETTYESVDLPLSAVSMSWSDDMRVLTISPDAGLAYVDGAGNDPSTVPAKVYTLSIGKGAADLAGNSLGNDFVLSFATKRRMTTTTGLFPDLTRVLLGDTLLDASTDISVGDNDLNDRYVSLVSFDLQQLPAGATIESAVFKSQQIAPVGAPYSTLGAVRVAHLISATHANFLSTQSTALANPYSQDGTAEAKAIDVTAQVTDDMAHRSERGNLSQYRLQIDDPTNDNDEVDKAHFQLSSFAISLVYLAD